MIFSDFQISIYKTPPWFNSDHEAIEGQFNIKGNIKFEDTNEQQKLNYYKMDYDKLIPLLKNCEWFDKISDNNVNSTLDNFYETIFHFLNQCCPKKKKSSNNNKWSDKDIKIAFSSKMFLHKQYKRTKSNIDYELFKTARKNFKSLILTKKQSYIQNIENNIKTGNIRPFWTYYKANFKQNALPSFITLNESTSLNIKESCNLFANHFSSVYQKPNSNTYPDITLYNNEMIVLKQISTCETLKALQNININKVTSSDLLPSFVIRNIAETIAEPLTYIYNQALETNTFPDKFKISFITPIFKSGDKYNAKNYRPISILSHLAKIFERLLYNQIYNQLKSCITENQHGFVSKKSTTTNLSILLNQYLRTLENKAQTDVVYTDFLKAFDSVLHTLLMQKLKQFNFSSQAITFFETYLSNRKQFVTIKGSCSYLLTYYLV